MLVVGAEEEDDDEGERKTGEAAVEPTPPFPAWKTKKRVDGFREIEMG